MKTVSLRALGREAPSLDEVVLVTHESSVIGRYVPISVAMDDRVIAGIRPGEPASTERFGSSRPAPKPGSKK